MTSTGERMPAEDKSQPVYGLSSAEAAERLRIHGRNVVGEVRVTPAWKIFLRQFTGLLVLLLI
ncbi:MAG: cation-transporting P-type ATPase, partial [Thalassovita sp.]|nr:cation-transporting P-type ATPase [Thalassovita sp.]